MSVLIDTSHKFMLNLPLAGLIEPSHKAMFEMLLFFFVQLIERHHWFAKHKPFWRSSDFHMLFDGHKSQIHAQIPACFSSNDDLPIFDQVAPW